MEDFFSYIRELFEAFIKDLGLFFKESFGIPWSSVPGNFRNYSDILNAYISGFGFWGWFFFVLFNLLWLALLGGVVYLVYFLIKRFIAYNKGRLDKQKLVQQVQELNDKLYSAVMEKNEILNLKVGSLGIPPGQAKADSEANFANSRFPKLSAVDFKYSTYNTHVEIQEADSNISLDQLVNKFRNFAASQMKLYYDQKTLRTFFAGMGTSKLLILEGISGTGKTSLPYALGKFFQNDTKICSVQPSWRDRTELIGYYNEFAKKFNETDFLKAVYEATFREDNNLIILDEMNLARIEYYFAEFLSIMEMPNVSEWKIEISNKPEAGDPKHLNEGKLLIPQNLWFIGTANNDDSTFTITDKVYDRAMSLEFSGKGVAFDCPFTESMTLPFQYMDKLFQEARTNFPMSEDLLNKFAKLDTFIVTKFNIAFGNRIIKQMKIFVPTYVACGGTDIEAMDYIFSSKILKKFVTLNLAFLHDEMNQLLNELDKLFGKGAFRLSRAVLEKYIKMS